jgi:hypothetical protein
VKTFGTLRAVNGDDTVDIQNRIRAAAYATKNPPVVGDAQTDAAIAKWRTSMSDQVAKIKAKYAAGQPVSELRKDVTRWWKVATEFAVGAPNLSNITDAQIAQAKYNANNLREMRLYLMTTNLVRGVPTDVRLKAVGYMTAPVEWLQYIGTPALQKEADYADMVRAAAKLPGLGLDSLEKLLGTALGVVIVGGIGYALWKVKHHG